MQGGGHKQRGGDGGEIGGVIGSLVLVFCFSSKFVLFVFCSLGCKLFAEAFVSFSSVLPLSLKKFRISMLLMLGLCFFLKVALIWIFFLPFSNFPTVTFPPSGVPPIFEPNYILTNKFRLQEPPEFYLLYRSSFKL